MSDNPAAANRPLRIFEKVLEGGLGSGNVGAVIARHGTGKDAVLTLLAVDKAMMGANVLIVTLDRSVADTRAFRDEVLTVVEDSIDLKDRASMLTKVERHTRIHAYPGSEFHLDKVRKTLAFAKEHAEFGPALIEFQGWPHVGPGKTDALADIAAFAKETGAEIWITIHTHSDDQLDEQGLPQWLTGASDHLSTIVALEPAAETVPLRFVKVKGHAPASQPHLEFDPKSMLLRWR